MVNDYIVIRDPDEPSISGKWYDRNDILPSVVAADPRMDLTYTPTPFIEVREDGAVAQVWMRKRNHG